MDTALTRTGKARRPAPIALKIFAVFAILTLLTILLLWLFQTVFFDRIYAKAPLYLRAFNKVKRLFTRGKC